MRKGIRGQISVFLIIAVIFIFSTIYFYLSYSNQASGKEAETLTTSYDFNIEADVLNGYIKLCLEYETQEAITNLNLFDPNCHLIPGDIAQLQSEISAFITANIENCIDFGYFEAKGMTIEKESPQATAIINEDIVLVELDYPLTLKHNDKSFSTARHNYLYSCSPETPLIPTPPAPTPTPPTPPLPTPPIPTSTPPTPPVPPELPDQKVFLLIFNPVIASAGGAKLTELQNWQDPDDLTAQYISDIKEASHGLVNYVIYKRTEVDSYPVKKTGYVFTYPDYYQCMLDSPPCDPAVPNLCCDGVNYNKILEDYHVCDMLNSGEISELWVFGGPWFGFFEANMAGTGAWYTNGDIIYGTTCNTPLHIMGFNYEREVGEMLEDFGHRVEGTLTHKVFHVWDVTDGTSEWDRFGYNKGQTPGTSIYGCGNVHYAPNSLSDYQWDSLEYVQSSCDDWYNYPNLKGETKLINCAEWGCDARAHLIWWLKHLPKDWWKLQFSG